MRLQVPHAQVVRACTGCPRRRLSSSTHGRLIQKGRSKWSDRVASLIASAMYRLRILSIMERVPAFRLPTCCVRNLAGSSLECSANLCANLTALKCLAV